MRKTGVIWVGHPDYVNGHVSAVQKSILASIQDIPFLCTDLQTIAITEQEAVQITRSLLHEHDCCAALVIFSTWIECSVAMAVLKELRGLPCMFWGFQQDEVNGVNRSTGSYVSATMFAGVVKRLKLRCPMLYTTWKNPDTQKKIEQFVRAAGAVDALNYSKIGLFGYTSMSIYTGTFDHVLMRYLVGPEIEHMDTYSLIRASEAASEEELAAAREKLADMVQDVEQFDPDTLKRSLSLYVGMKKICREKGWNAFNIKCQYELSQEYRAVPCVAISMLAEDNLVTSCEGDTPLTVSMLMLQYLCGKTVWYGDSLTHWDNVLQFSPCGFLPPKMAKGKPELLDFGNGRFAGGLHMRGVLRPEKITWMRLVEDIGSYHIIYGTGQGIATEPRGGTMPALNVKLDGSIEKLFGEYAGQHFAVAYGDLSEDIAMMGSIMGIEARRI